MKDEVLYPFKATGEITGLYLLIFTKTKDSEMTGTEDLSPRRSGFAPKSARVIFVVDKVLLARFISESF